jgi:hypothetical protein
MYETDEDMQTLYEEVLQPASPAPALVRNSG